MEETRQHRGRVGGNGSPKIRVLNENVEDDGGEKKKGREDGRETVKNEERGSSSKAVYRTSPNKALPKKREEEPRNSLNCRKEPTDGIHVGNPFMGHQ